jgi:hypothetical protein
VAKRERRRKLRFQAGAWERDERGVILRLFDLWRWWGEFFVEYWDQGVKGLIGLIAADVGDQDQGEIKLGVEPDVGQVHDVGAAVEGEGMRGPGDGELAPAQGVLTMFRGAGLGTLFFRGWR